MLDSAKRLLDLAELPGNHLKALRGSLRGCYSNRINEQWRIVFRGQGSDVHEVRIVDYHGG